MEDVALEPIPPFVNAIRNTPSAGISHNRNTATGRAPFVDAINLGATIMTDMPPAELERRIVQAYGTAIRSLTITKEFTQLGQPHLHVYIRWFQRKKIFANKMASLLGFYDGKRLWPHIHAVTDAHLWLDYMFKVHKDDDEEFHGDQPPPAGSWTTWGRFDDLPQQAPRSDHIRASWNQIINFGRTPPSRGKYESFLKVMTEHGKEEAKRRYPAIYFQKKSAADQIHAEDTVKKAHAEMLASLLPWKPIDLEEARKLDLRPYFDRKAGKELEGGPNYFLAKTLNWYFNNRDKPAFLAQRKMHIWLTGVPNSGKSRLLRFLGKFLYLYQFHIGEQTKWQVPYPLFFIFSHS